MVDPLDDYVGRKVGSRFGPEPPQAVVAVPDQVSAQHVRRDVVAVERKYLLAGREVDATQRRVVAPNTFSGIYAYHVVSTLLVLLPDP